MIIHKVQSRLNLKKSNNKFLRANGQMRFKTKVERESQVCQRKVAIQSYKTY